MGGFGAIEEQVRRNMEMFERTFSMFAPFARQGQAGETPADADNAAKPVAGGAAPGGDIDDLKRQIDEMQKRIERIGDKDK
jgi:polyhydroxyalkanoate synthesis regulator protein